MYRLDDVLQPPPPPDLQRTRQSIIRHLSMVTMAAGLMLLAALTLVGTVIVLSLQAGQVAAASFGMVVLVGVYYGIGIALCASFMSRLRLWGGASFAHVIAAKGNFVRRWPVEAARLLRNLVLHRMTGGGLPPAYPGSGT